MCCRNRTTRRRRRERGQATVEFALVLPFLFLFMLGLVQLALLVRDQVLVVHAAREAAREASVGSGDARVRAAATTVLHDAHVTIGPRTEVGAPVEVQVTFVERAKVPIVDTFFPDRTLHASAVMRVEHVP